MTRGGKIIDKHLPGDTYSLGWPVSAMQCIEELAEHSAALERVAEAAEWLIVRWHSPYAEDLEETMLELETALRAAGYLEGE